jgi:hypothetical protein
MIINRSMSPLRKAIECVPHSSRSYRDEWEGRRRLLVRSLVFALVMMLATVARAGDKPRPAPPVKPAPEYVMHESHPNEKVTVAADPCDDSEQCKFFRLPYVSHGFLPVRVIITNDRDQQLELDEVRIQFFPAEGEKEAAATDDDLNRRLFHGKDAAGTKLPIIPITIHHQPVDQKILNDDTDFGFTSLVVPPHTTRAGYVFYDTRTIDDPVMKHAELYVKMIHTTDEKGAKVELFAFTLPFDKWLAAQPPEPPAKK